MIKKFIRRKLAYTAVQNVTSIFDDRLERIKGFSAEHNAKRSISLFGYYHKILKGQEITVWFDGEIPTNANVFEKIELSVATGLNRRSRFYWTDKSIFIIIKYKFYNVVLTALLCK